MKKQLFYTVVFILLITAAHAQSFSFLKQNEHPLQPQNRELKNAEISETLMPKPAHLFKTGNAAAPAGNRLQLPGASKGRTAYGVIYSPEEHAGYWTWDVDNILGKSLIKPLQSNVPLPEGEFPYLLGADFVGGRIYGYSGIGSSIFYVADAISGEIISSNAVSTLDGILVADMAYDHSSGSMYLVAGNNLIKISLTDGSVISFKPIAAEGSIGTVMTLAIDLEGNMYCINDGLNGNASNLYSIDNTTYPNVAAATLIGSTGKSALYNQSMGFDHYTNTLYWNQMTVGNDQNFMTVNTTTGEATVVQPVSWETTAFFIPYYNVDAGAPAAVSDLTVTPGASGALTATLAWTNPSLTFGGSALTDLDTVKVYRNSETEPIYTIDNPATGEAETFNTNVDAPGSYRYRVVAVNSLGEMAATAVKYIGIDRPSAPTGVLLERDGMTANLSWTAPAEGLTGNYFSQEGLVYDIYRLPYDNIKVASDLTGTSFSETLDAPSVYLYKVVAKNAAGEGGGAESNYIFFCPSCTEFPWTLGFEADESTGCIESIFVSGNTSWQMVGATGSPASVHGGSMKACFRTYTTGSKTKMVMPAMDITGLTVPVLEFWHAQPDFAGFAQDVLRVYYRTSAEGEWTLLEEYTESIPDWTKQSLVLPNPSANYYVAFEGHSNNANGVHLDDVTIKEADGVSLSGIVSNGTSPLEGAKVAIAGTNIFDMTAADGSYEIAQIEAGTYKIATSLHGYITDSVDIAFALENVTQNITLTSIPSFTVSGKVTSVNAPSGLPNVQITLSGYENYSATTDASGNWSIQGVYDGFTYSVKAMLLGYNPYTSTVEVNTADANHNIALTEIAYPVVGQEAVISGINTAVSWNAPASVHADTLIYDDGSKEDGISMQPSQAYWIGNRFETDETGIITGIEMYGSYSANASERTVTVEIFNEAQQPVAVSEPFHLPSEAWITVPLDNISYSGTFYAMIHWTADPGYTHFLGMDTSGENGISMAYSGTAWNTLVEVGGGAGVCMIRAHVNVIESAKAITPAPAGYTVYRLTEGQTDETAWNELATVTETSFTDTGWTELPAGAYQYAVKAKYAGENLSQAALTNTLSNVHTITVSATPEAGGTVTGGGDYTTGTSITITATPAANYTFVNWTENGSEVTDAEAEYTFTVTGNRTLVANFALEQFEVTYNAPEHGTLEVIASGSPVTSGSQVDYNTVLTIIATPDDGYKPESLTVNGTDFNSGDTHTVTGNVNIECTFTQDVGIDDSLLSGITVYGNESNVYIVNPNNIPLKSVEVLDVLGRVVYSGKAGGSVTIPVNGAGGIYIVHMVSDDNNVLSAKVILND